MRSTIDERLAREAAERAPEARFDAGSPAWQLRGMATDPAVRGTGAGLRLLTEARAVLSVWSPVYWCNARRNAVGFYQRAGWTVVSEEFNVPDVGPHVRMVTRGA